MKTDDRVQKVQDLAGRINALRKSYRKAPSYHKAVQIQRLSKVRQGIIASLRGDFELAVNNG